MKNTKKHSNKTLPSIGSVSSSNVTRMRIPEWINRISVRTYAKRQVVSDREVNQETHYAAQLIFFADGDNLVWWISIQIVLDLYHIGIHS